MLDNKAAEEANIKVDAAWVAVEAVDKAVADIRAVAASKAVDAAMASTTTVAVAKAIVAETKALITETPCKGLVTKATGVAATPVRARLLYSLCYKVT